MRPIRAVLTGDLVASAESTPESVDEALRALEAAARQVRLWGGRDTHFTRYGGARTVRVTPPGARAPGGEARSA